YSELVDLVQTVARGRRRGSGHAQRDQFCTRGRRIDALIEGQLAPPPRQAEQRPLYLPPPRGQVVDRGWCWRGEHSLLADLGRFESLEPIREAVSAHRRER